MNDKIKDLLLYCLQSSSKHDMFEWQTQIFIITTKSIIPFENKIGCGIYYKRFIKELNLLKDYCDINGSIIQNKINNQQVIKFDNAIDYKILPIVISNTDWNIIIDEVVKSVVFFTNDANSIILSIILSRILMDYMNEKVENNHLIESVKDSLIQFSIKDIMEKYYKKKLNNKYLINFERERINWLNTLNSNLDLKVNLLGNSKIYEYITLNKSKTIDIPKQNEKIINNFALYLSKLRKGTINPDKLKIDLEHINPLEFYLSKSKFTHPLLGKCIVGEKKLDDYIIIKTKTGLIKVKK